MQRVLNSANIVRTRDESDFQMINSIDIKNFRCFKEQKITGLKRFNFIVGESGSGKTALLESIFLAGGANPEIYFRVRRWRGFSEALQMEGTKYAYESVFRDLFYNFRQETGAYIRLQDSERGYRSLQIGYESNEALDLPLKASSSASEDVFTVPPIVFKWENPKQISRSEVEVREDGRLKMTGKRDVYPVTFVNPQTINAAQNALRYSELSKRNKESLFFEALHHVFPEVHGVSLEAIAGEFMIHVSLDGLSEKLPIVDLSGGMNKYISIVLSVISMANGAVIVDEMENGFYYRSLPMMLRNMMELCEENKTQLFATTHSYEFLQSVAEVIRKDDKLKKHTTLVRLERDHAEQPSIKVIDGHGYEAAISSNFEVR
ncbi:MAG: hypothetical protein C5B51_14095 [Terriglobia bacterium]|nr:MAG: hypothetical protein C5B51_14095 [Terriglobia bacterium]